MDLLSTYVIPQEKSVPKTIMGNSFAAVWAFIIAFGYGVAIAVSPLVYINIFITAAFGMILGFGVRIATRIFKVTHKPTALGMGVTAGVVGVIFSWVSYIIYWIVDGSKIDAYFIDIAFVREPGVFIDMLMIMNAEGIWEIAGIPFNGWILTIIWIVEALMIIAISTLVVRNQNQSPFSIKLNKWYKQFILIKDFESIAMKEDFAQSVAVDCVKTIDDLGSGEAYHYSRISVYYLENEELQYLMAENVRKDRSGKSEKAIEVIPLVVISPEDARTIIDKFHGSSPSFFDY